MNDAKALPKEAKGAKAAPARLSREDFLAVRQYYIQVEHDLANRFDSLVVGGAAGALVLSITFIEKIAATPAQGTVSILVAGWVVLLVTLAFSLTAMHTGQKEFRQRVEKLDQDYQGLTAVGGYTSIERWARATGTLNAISATGLLAGIILLAYFAIANLPGGSTDERETQSGEAQVGEAQVGEAQAGEANSDGS